VAGTVVGDEEAGGPFAHPALFYRGDAEFLAGTVPFVREGLAEGGQVAVAVPRHNLALLHGELGVDAGRVRLLDMTTAGRNPGRIIPAVLRAFADAHSGRPVRIVGEPIWPARSEWEYPACVRYEALVNLAFAGRDVTILCPYDAAALAGSVLADAEATHPVLIDRDGRRDSAAYAPDRIIATYNRPLPEPTEPTTAAEARTPADVTKVRRLARDYATAAGLSADRVINVEVTVAELITNSIEHGGGAGSVRLWIDNGHLICDVHDHGTFTDPLAGHRPARPHDPRGRGLLLVNQLADLVRTHTGGDGTTLRAHFRL
jgi:anti-sigma regulatory factor (Ser/Thr protein kinase)